ncbi:MAG: glutamate synthase subunit alpha, partial [Actinobacteria bacterium]|nr:glutamate synthase subunit alpha [Actinomycetota bacterium]
MNPDLPLAHGLYDPRFEHDACGVSFVANIKGVRSREIVTLGITALCNMEHRGATGAEADTGDGAGILIQVPDAFLRAVVDFSLPVAGAYAAGVVFLPADPTRAATAMATVEKIMSEEGLRPLGWRDVPNNPDCLGASARAMMPIIRQFFVDDPAGAQGIDLDRKIFVPRKRIESVLVGDIRTYFSSLSSRTLVYKGMFTTPELGDFFPDLWDERMESCLALVHSRFSTNTFPSWPLAHPYRYIAHNGEINTVQGNRNWMATREALLDSDMIPGLERAFPICSPDMSDSASFDEVLELLHLSGRTLPHALLMMIPEAWENNENMDPARRAFYRFHSSLMEPWDGPADIAFTDGTLIGAVLDRNGLRPGRYWVTSDDLVVLASEAGVLDIEPSRVIRKGRLQPGKMFLVDTSLGRIVDDEEIKTDLAAQHPYEKWLTEGLTELSSLPAREHVVYSNDSVTRRQQMFGYTEEELKVILAPTARTGTEPLGSMGTDTPIAVLSDRSRLLFDYFQQLFAQVTNPPLDAIREEVVTAIGTSVGPEANLLAPG